MARNYQRKTKPKAQEAFEALKAAWDKYALPDQGRPSGTLLPVGHADGSWCVQQTYLHMWLLKLYDNPLACSALLQAFVSLSQPPQGVFVDRFGGEGRGRPSKYELGLKASRLHKPNTFGWHKVAKTLIPDDYKKNHAHAAKKVKDAAQRYEHRAATKPDYWLEIKDLARRMLAMPNPGYLAYLVRKPREYFRAFSSPER
jgi:hypothetical protein